MAEWKGSLYRRSDGTWRQRGTGHIVSNVKVKKRRGMRDKAVYFNGKGFKYLGNEPKLKNFYGTDIRKSKSAEKRFRSRAEQKAMFRKLKGRR